MKRIYQSYLIVGPPKEARAYSIKLLASLGVEIKENSPDVHFVQVGNNTQKGRSRGLSISIDQIRDLKKLIFQKPFYLKFRVVIIEKSQLLTTEAQNALLKILEEPPASSLLILEATNKFSLVSTIRSRVVIYEVNDSKANKRDYNFVIGAKTQEEFMKIVANVENPIDWLDGLILASFDSLEEEINQEKSGKTQRLERLIEDCIYTKKLIEANVDGKFALFGLALKR